MRDLRTDELTHVYGATGIGKLLSCFKPVVCKPAKKSKSKNSCKPAKKSKSKKGWC